MKHLALTLNCTDDAFSHNFTSHRYAFTQKIYYPFLSFLFFFLIYHFLSEFLLIHLHSLVSVKLILHLSGCNYKTFIEVIINMMITCLHSSTTQQYHILKTVWKAWNQICNNTAGLSGQKIRPSSEKNRQGQFTVDSMNAELVTEPRLSLTECSTELQRRITSAVRAQECVLWGQKEVFQLKGTWCVPLPSIIVQWNIRFPAPQPTHAKHSYLFSSSAAPSMSSLFFFLCLYSLFWLFFLFLLFDIPL